MTTALPTYTTRTAPLALLCLSALFACLYTAFVSPVSSVTDSGGSAMPLALSVLFGLVVVAVRFRRHAEDILAGLLFFVMFGMAFVLPAPDQETEIWDGGIGE